MIKRAIISVSDKTGIADFARKLVELNVEILSTGGTAKLLEKEGIPCKEVSEITGFPECLDGRVKTLHPLIHGGILAMRGNPEHMKRVTSILSKQPSRSRAWLLKSASRTSTSAVRPCCVLLRRTIRTSP